MNASQLSLYDMQVIGAPHNGTPTSIAAAQSIKPHIGPMQRRILDYLDYEGPLTQEEISVGTGLRLQSVNGRINELARIGLVKDIGWTAPTSSGRRAVVWTLPNGHTVPLTNFRAGQGRVEDETRPVAASDLDVGNQRPEGGGAIEEG